MAEENKDIQGYSDGVFWERNTLSLQKKSQKASAKKKEETSLFNKSSLRLLNYNHAIKEIAIMKQ